jgi:hypothetical protein
LEFEITIILRCLLKLYFTMLITTSQNWIRFFKIKLHVVHEFYHIMHFWEMYFYAWILKFLWIYIYCEKLKW